MTVRPEPRREGGTKGEETGWSLVRDAVLLHKHTVNLKHVCNCLWTFVSFEGTNGHCWFLMMMLEKCKKWGKYFEQVGKSR